jgi:rare lipoprotein A
MHISRRRPLRTLIVLAAGLAACPALAQTDGLSAGTASYYGRELAGNRTASGERFDPDALTAAHRTLPLGSLLRITNKANGKSVVVRVNDRGPFHKSRILDMSWGAARALSMLRAGKAMVSLELLR